MKKMLAAVLIVILSLSCGSVAAEQSTTKEDKKITPRIYTEDKLVDMYTKESTDIRKLDIDYEVLQLEYDNLLDEKEDQDEDLDAAKQKYERIKDKDNREGSELKDAREAYEKAVDKHATYEKQLADKKFEIDLIKTKKEQQLQKLQDDFRTTLWNYDILKQQLNILEEAVSLAEANLKVAQTKFEMEISTEVELNKAKNDLESQKINLEKLKNSVQMAKNNIKTLANIPDNVPVTFDIKIAEMKEPLNFTYDFICGAYKDASLKIKEQKNNINTHKTYIDRLAEVYKSDDDEFETKKLEYDKLLLQDYDFDKNIDLKLINDYYTYKKAAETLTIERDNLALANQQLKNQKLQYEAGKLSKLQYQATENANHAAKFNYDKTVVNYNNALVKLLQIIKGIDAEGGVQ